MRNGVGSPEATELDSQIQQLLSEQQSAIGGIPSGFWDKFSGDILGSVGYTLDIATKSMLNSVVTNAALTMMLSKAGGTFAGPIGGATAAALASSAAAAQGVVASFARSKELSRGAAFYDMMHMVDENGNPLPYDADTAWVLADIKGDIVGFTEAMFDGVVSRLGSSFSAGTARRLGIPGLSVRMLTDSGLSGTSARIAYGVGDWLAGGLNEGFIQEGTEALTDSFMTALYENAIGTEPDLSVRKLAHDYFESALTGTLVGLVYGGLSVPSSMRQYNQLSFELRRIAETTPSREAYFEETERLRPEDVSRDDFNQARETIFGEAMDNQAERSQKPGGVFVNQDTVLEEMYTTVNPDTGEETSVVPDGSVYRTPDSGRLYTETREENGKRYVYAGDPNSRAVYGYAEISTDDDTLSVGSVRIRPGYESIRAELVRDAISSQRTGERNISWEPETIGLKTVRDILIQNNPKGQEAGLDYGADLSYGQDHDIQQLASMISKEIPSLSSSASMVAARIYSLADRDNLLTYANKGRFIQNLADANPDDRNLAQRYRGAADAANAIIYAGQHADFSTFYHELFHVNAYQRPSDARRLSNAISTAMADDASRENLRKFIEEASEIWGKGFDVNQVMDSLASIATDADASSWTRGQFEDLARLAEAYALTDNSRRTSLPEAIRNIMRKIAEFMREVYQTVRHTVPLPKEITDAYDRLMYEATQSNVQGSTKSDDSLMNQNRRVQSRDEVADRLRTVTDSGEFVKAKDIDVLSLKNDKGNMSLRAIREATKDIRGTYTNNETGEVITFGRTSIGELAHHDFRNDEHIVSIFSIPEFIKNGHYLGTAIDSEGRTFTYYLSLFDYNGKQYLVRSVVRRELNGFYYDHKLTPMEKIKDYLSGGIELPILGLPNGNPSTIDDRRLLGFLQGESELLFQDVDSVATEERLRADSSNFNEDGHHLAPNGEPSNLTYEQWVTVRTPSFLAWFGDWINDPDNASKVVDENGEPLVVYHGSFADFSVFDRTKTRANMDIQGNFFSPWAEDSEGYGPNVRAFFLNLRNPAGFRDGYKALNTFKGQDNAGVKARELLASRGFDGVNNDGEEYIAFEPNQIKSVDNRGTFDESNPDIYFQDAPDDYQPEKTGIGYKVFYLHDGKLYPPMVANSGGVDTPVERWLLAESGEIAGYTKTGRPQVRAGGKGTNASKQMLAYRPGWHLGEIPYALQFSKTNPLTGERGSSSPQTSYGLRSSSRWMLIIKRRL